VNEKLSEVVVSDRARWLAELAVAIEQAQKVAWRLGVTEGQDPEALDLYAQLESAREEIEVLRCGGWSGEQQPLDPFWIKFLPWRTMLADAAD
jgi:hypothetical protein